MSGKRDLTRYKRACITRDISGKESIKERRGKRRNIRVPVNCEQPGWMALRKINLRVRTRLHVELSPTNEDTDPATWESCSTKMRPEEVGGPPSEKTRPAYRFQAIRNSDYMRSDRDSPRKNEAVNFLQASLESFNNSTFDAKSIDDAPLSFKRPEEYVKL